VGTQTKGEKKKMNSDKIIDFYLERINSKDFDLYSARQEMTKNNIPEDEIKSIIRILDSEMQKQMILTHENKKATNIVLVGIVLASIGAGITIATYTGIIPMGDSFLLTYGPFLGGLSIIFGGLVKKRTDRQRHLN
jgi:hypothetical protein